uniref:Uncharacterized protein n=1 Tax=Caenorhabditis tropicalis TaxID=1561998 RepID=A0A1I7UZL5_9PELO
MLFNVKFLISFTYCSMSFLLYTLLIIMLLTNWKQFKSAFFYIVIADFFFIWQVLFPVSLGIIIICAVYSTRTILHSDPYFVYNEALDMYSIKTDTVRLEMIKMYLRKAPKVSSILAKSQGEHQQMAPPPQAPPPLAPPPFPGGALSTSRTTQLTRF